MLQRDQERENFLSPFESILTTKVEVRSFAPGFDSPYSVLQMLEKAVSSIS
jgi:hypothetical protein